VRFVTDANGQGYGSGWAAAGGTAEHAEHPPPERPRQPVPAPVVREREAIATRLSRQPLLRSRDGCRGHFPTSAAADRGEVALVATVRANGALAGLEIERELPLGQGFARAARACLRDERFEPALDPEGQPVMARTRIVLRFSR
jgi:hypothetical protein